MVRFTVFPSFKTAIGLPSLYTKNQTLSIVRFYTNEAVPKLTGSFAAKTVFETGSNFPEFLFFTLFC
jgi:hypothetical protein